MQYAYYNIEHTVNEAWGLFDRRTHFYFSGPSCSHRHKANLMFKMKHHSRILG